MDELFHGLYVPLITPFTVDGGLAADALESLARHVLDLGAAGLVALGTTAETPTLADSERAQVLDICSAVSAERGTTLIAGAGSNDTAGSERALDGLAKWPQVSAALVVVPYYTRPGEAGVSEHFRRLAGVSPVPLILYNIPFRTGQQLSWRTVCQLAGEGAIAGVKHSPGCLDADTIALLANRPAGFSVLGGDDAFASAVLALGASGMIAAAANVLPAEFAALTAAWQAGQAADARALGHRVAGLSAALFAEPNPAVIKAVLHARGQIPTPLVRLPLLQAAATSADTVLTMIGADSGGLRSQKPPGS